MDRARRGHRIAPGPCATSPREDSEESLPLGDFGGAVIADAGSSLFENIVDRTEEEILELFVSTAEAATCPSSSCSSDSEATVVVVATITENPTNSACIQARVTNSVCDSTCDIFKFTASVNGSSVAITDGGGCELQLTNIVLSAGGLNGKWAFDRESFHDAGNFFSAANGGGCDSLRGCF